MARAQRSREQWTELAAAAGYEVKALAGFCRVSVRQLQREFRREFGRTPREWLNEQRMLAAQQRLRAGEPVKQVAADLGFKQVSHFYRQFKSLSRMTTSEFLAAESGMSPADTKCRPEAQAGG